jgi:Ni/Co efflux regulator RcnB
MKKLLVAFLSSALLAAPMLIAAPTALAQTHEQSKPLVQKKKVAKKAGVKSGAKHSSKSKSKKKHRARPAH